MKFAFAPEATPLPGYTIKRAIDRGGFGEVYYALSDSGKEVALKLLQRNQQVELRGVTQCLNLKHPNLVTIFDIRTDADDDHWVVMEFVAGKSLEQTLEDNPRGLSPPEVEAWLAGMAAGIGFLHDRGIVHRDLKPANIFRENGVVKIGDIGLSKFITPSRRSAQTESVGTVYYMAPEVARGKYGCELDVYSLGVMLFEMLTGKVPFDGESTGEILMKHLTEHPDLSKIAAPFRPVIARALEKDPLKRTPGALQLLDDFRRALAGQAVAIEIPGADFAAAAHRRTPVVEAVSPPMRYNTNGSSPANGMPVDDRARARGATSSRQPTHADMPTVWQRVQEEFRRNPWLAVPCVIVLAVLFPLVYRIFLGRGLVPALPMLGAGGYLAYYFFTRIVQPNARFVEPSRHAARPTADAEIAFARSHPAQPPATPPVSRNISSAGKPDIAFRCGIILLVGVLLTPVFRTLSQTSSGLISQIAAWFAMFSLAISAIIAAGYAGRKLQEREANQATLPSGAAPPDESSRFAPTATNRQAVSNAPVSQASNVHRGASYAPVVTGHHLSPQTIRPIALRTRLSELSSALTFAVFWALAVTAGFVALDGVRPVFTNQLEWLRDPARASTFALTTLLGAWAVLLPAKLWEGYGSDTARRRLIQTALGAAVGACGWWVGDALFAPLPFGSVFPGMFSRIGSAPLLVNSSTPSLAGFVVFFAALFGLRRWWWQADSFRDKKFRIGSLLMSAIVAFFIPAAFAFPQTWGVCVATAISAVVQLSAPWTPPKDRPARLDA